MSGTMPQLVVVGAINMDLVSRVPRLPRPGETITGNQLRQIPGGKGANQAVAAAQLGAAASMIGRVGDDGFALALRQSLAARNVETRSIMSTDDCSSGVALISVEDSGENAITYIPGANGRFVPGDLKGFEAEIAAADILLLQLEIPLNTVGRAIGIARQNNVPVVLDPAPMPDQLPAEFLQVDLLSPNQTESELLTGIAVVDVESAARASDLMLESGARQVAIKMGAQGAWYQDACGQSFYQPAPPSNAVDTTAAGDAFTAALAVAMASHRPIEEGVRQAVAAGSLSTTRPGAQPAMPCRADVDQLLADRSW